MIGGSTVLADLAVALFALYILFLIFMIGSLIYNVIMERVDRWRHKKEMQKVEKDRDPLYELQ